MAQSNELILATQILVPTPMSLRLASRLKVSLISNTVISTSSKFTYPAVGNAESVGKVVVTGNMSGDVIL